MDQNFNQTIENVDQHDSDDENLDGDEIERVGDFNANPHHFDAQDKTAIVSLDDLIAVYTENTGSFKRLILNDLQER